MKELKTDIFPLYYFNVPGILKNLIDRQLPMSTRQDGYGNGSHEARYDMEGKRHVLISTCGFYSANENYARTGAISKETDEILRTLLYPKDVFEKMADASWGINKTTGKKEPDDLVFIQVVLGIPLARHSLMILVHCSHRTL